MINCTLLYVFRHSLHHYQTCSEFVRWLADVSVVSLDSQTGKRAFVAAVTRRSLGSSLQGSWLSFVQRPAVQEVWKASHSWDPRFHSLREQIRSELCKPPITKQTVARQRRSVYPTPADSMSGYWRPSSSDAAGALMAASASSPAAPEGQTWRSALISFTASEEH